LGFENGVTATLSLFQYQPLGVMPISKATKLVAHYAMDSELVVIKRPGKPATAQWVGTLKRGDPRTSRLSAARHRPFEPPARA
jgi:hypothetical protein